MNNKINKVINALGEKMSNTDKIPAEFARLEKAYIEYCNSMKKSDFCNSYSRYIIENDLVADLLNVAKKLGLQEQIAIYSCKSQEILAKLTEYGIKPL